MDPRTIALAQGLIEASLRMMTEELGLAPADAGRTLLRVLARWFGIFEPTAPADSLRHRGF
jgi:hypothetical protein